MATRTGGNRSWHWFINILAYFAFVGVGIVLVFNQFGWGGGILWDIAFGLSCIVVGLCSFAFVMTKFRGKRGIVWLIVWIIAAVLVTIFYIIPFANKVFG